MAVSLMVFALAWNLRRLEHNSQIMVLGLFSLAILLIGLAHTVSYAGMPDLVTPSGPEKAINFWLAGRIVAAIGFLVIAVLPMRHWSERIWVPAVLLTVLAVVFVWWVGLYHAQWLPRTFVAGEGLTRFKVLTEYAIAAVFALAAVILLRRARREHGTEAAWLAASAWTLGLTEMYFTLYANVTDLFNLLGHLFLVVAYVMVYRAIFVAGVQEPYRLLARETSLLRSLIDSIPDLISYTDREGRYVGANRAFSDRTGLSEADLIGRTEEELGRPITVEGDGQESTRQPEMRATRRFEESIPDRQGHGGLFDTVRTPYFESTGVPLGVIEVSRDVTAQKQAEQRIHQLALYDQLTGLPNRFLFRDDVDEALRLACGEGTPHAILFLDLDDFKTVNDTLGHRVGDLLIQEAGRRIASIAAPGQTVSRLGGDEFALLLPGADLNEAARVAQRLISRIDEPFRLEQYELTITPSIGISMFPVDGADFESLSRCADAAMYRAKQEGRNDYLLLHQRHPRADRPAPATAVRPPASGRGRSAAPALPATGVLLGWADRGSGGARAMAASRPRPAASGRLHRPRRGQRPDPFHRRLGPAHGTAGCDVVGGPRSPSDHLGGQHLGRAVPPARLHRQGRAPPSRRPASPRSDVELELTETVAMRSPEAAVATVGRLHGLGVTLSIDDFGTGYSSMAYLKRFRINHLKIDQSFVRDLGHDPEDEAIVQAIIEVAKAVHCTTIAEGVETDGASASTSRLHGCDEGQGFVIGPALPPDQLPALLLAEARHPAARAAHGRSARARHDVVAEHLEHVPGRYVRQCEQRLPCRTATSHAPALAPRRGPGACEAALAPRRALRRPEAAARAVRAAAHPEVRRPSARADRRGSVCPRAGRCPASCRTASTPRRCQRVVRQLEGDADSLAEGSASRRLGQAPAIRAPYQQRGGDERRRSCRRSPPGGARLGPGPRGVRPFRGSAPCRAARRCCAWIRTASGPRSARISDDRANRKSPVRMAMVLSQRALADWAPRRNGGLVHDVVVVERRQVRQLDDDTPTARPPTRPDRRTARPGARAAGRNRLPPASTRYLDASRRTDRRWPRQHAGPPRRAARSAASRSEKAPGQRKAQQGPGHHGSIPADGAGALADEDIGLVHQVEHGLRHDAEHDRDCGTSRKRDRGEGGRHDDGGRVRLGSEKNIRTITRT